jgi:hypothetical protein
MAYISNVLLPPNTLLFVNGQGSLPFQFRALCFWIIRGMLHSSVIQHAAVRFAPFHKDPYLCCIFLLAFVSLLLAVLFTRASIKLLTGSELWSLVGSFLLLVMTSFSLMLNFEHQWITPYDLPSLFFFSACIYAVLARKFPLYYLLFSLAVFNRETCIFLIPFFAICLWLENKNISWKLGAHVAAQASIWLAIKLWLLHLYANNPLYTNDPKAIHGVKGLFDLQVFYNLAELLKPWQWTPITSVFGFLLPVYILGFRYIRDQRVALGSAVMLVLWACGMLFVGFFIEIRIFNELNSIMAIAITLIACHLTQFDLGNQKQA